MRVITPYLKSLQVITLRISHCANARVVTDLDRPKLSTVRVGGAHKIGYSIGLHPEKNKYVRFRAGKPNHD